jgi:lysophospholipase L1-like esterase
MTNERWMKSLAVAIGVLGAFVIAELGIRLYFSWVVGPRVFLYGTGWYRNVPKGASFSESERAMIATEWGREDSVERHENVLGGYTKYFPYERKSTHDVDTGERIPVTINKHGFRGKDFDKEKPPGVFRILTLGASSTFGYYNRDNDTYPHHLEALLNERCPGPVRFEVINLAVPHAKSGDIAALFLSEGLGLAPDAVTFYEGRNDAVFGGRPQGAWQRLRAALAERVMLAALVESLDQGGGSVDHASLVAARRIAEGSKTFLRNLATILDAARSRGIYLVVANQQSTSRSPLPLPAAERLRFRGVSYESEAADIRRRIDGKHEVTAFEYALIFHRRLMLDLKRWAESNGVPFADVIQALDADRHLLLSWVHLHPEANRIVAAKLAEVLLPRFCPAKQ